MGQYDENSDVLTFKKKSGKKIICVGFEIKQVRDLKNKKMEREFGILFIIGKKPERQSSN